MQSQTVINTDIHRQWTLHLAQQEVADLVAQRLEKMQSSARMNGFRPGKVPLQELQRNYGAQAAEESLAQVVNEFCRDAIAKEDLKPAGMPQFSPNVQSAEPGLTITIDLLLQPNLPEFDPAAHPLTRYILSPAAIEQAIERAVMITKSGMVTHHSPAATTAVTPWAQVQAVFDLRLNDSAAVEPRYKALEREWVIGNGMFEPAFEKAMLGLTAGQSKEFSFTVAPDSVFMPEFANQTLHVSLELKSVAAPVRTTFEESDWKRLGYASEENFLEMNRERIKNIFTTQSQRLIVSNLCKSLVAQCPAKIPDVFLNGEATSILREQIKREKVNLPEEVLMQRFAQTLHQVREDATYAMVMTDYARRNSLAVDESEVERIFTSIVGNSANRNSAAIMSEIRARLWVGAAEKKMLELISVEEKVVNMPELLQAMNQSRLVTSS